MATPDFATGITLNADTVTNEMVSDPTGSRTLLARRLLQGGVMMQVGLVVLLLFALAAIFANVIAPYNPNAINLMEGLAPPSAAHWLGQDNLGRDVLSRIIYGARVSLSVSILAGILAGIAGVAFGMIAGYYGGLLGRLIMRLTDVVMSIPSLILALVVVGILGGSVASVSLAIGVGMVPSYVRMVNGLVLSLRENDYVVAAQLTGQRDIGLMARHLLPNAFAPILVIFTISLGNAVLTEATLSYLGVGISPPTASWGSMVSDVYPFLLTAPWLVIAPGVVIIVVIMAFNVVGEGLRDALDPRLKGRL